MPTLLEETFKLGHYRDFPRIPGVHLQLAARGETGGFHAAAKIA